MKRAGGRLLLVGGGHAHLQVLEAIAAGRITAAEVTLVSASERQIYSAMVPGFIEGRYTLEQIAIDLRLLARRLGAHFREAQVTRIDGLRRIAALDDGTTLPYDVASVAIGGAPAGGDLPGVRQFAKAVKPLPRVAELKEALTAAAAAGNPEPLQVIVVGAGAAGVEVALTARALLDRLGANRSIISLVESTHTPLRDRSLAAQEEAEAALKRGEITLRLSTAVEEVGANHVRVTGGRVIPADIVIWAAGTTAPALFRASGLPTDARGYLLVDDSLAVPSCPGLYGAGDAVSLESAPKTPKSGVQALRQGPVLMRNLALALGATPPGPAGPGAARFRPQRRALALLNCGNGSAIFSYGGFAATGGWAMTLKDWVDRRFVRRFQRLAV